MNDKSTDHQGLYTLASGQAGYFTSAQAHDYGFSTERLSYHAQTGRFQRVQRGLYRFRDFPSTADEEVVAAWVKIGRDDAFVSHATALMWHGLSDLIVDEVDITVPREARYLKSIPGVRIHTTTTTQAQGELQHLRGVQVSAPVRAIVESTAARVIPDQIEQAVFDLLDRRITTSDELLKSAKSHGLRTYNQIKQVVEAY